MISARECDSIEILARKEAWLLIVRPDGIVVRSRMIHRNRKKDATIRDRTRDLQIFSLTLSQLSYRGFHIQPRFRLDPIEYTVALCYIKYAGSKPTNVSRYSARRAIAAFIFQHAFASMVCYTRHLFGLILQCYIISMQLFGLEMDVYSTLSI